MQVFIKGYVECNSCDETFEVKLEMTEAGHVVPEWTVYAPEGWYDYEDYAYCPKHAKEGKERHKYRY